MPAVAAGLALAAGGGRPPYRGSSTASRSASDRLRPSAFWTPDGVGHVEIRVIDATGGSAMVDALVR